MIRIRSIGLYLALLVTVPATASGAGYCLAIRGNGEAEPAHWGAVANVIERMGLPMAQAGGSSATITMFLIDAVATNRAVKNASENERALRASLLIKSFEGFLQHLTATPQWRDFLLLFGRLQAIRQTAWLDQIEKVLKEPATLKENWALLKNNYKAGQELGFINDASFAPFKESLSAILGGNYSDFDVRRALFYAGELRFAITAVGAFDAATDDNLFFRPGLVNFDRLAGQLGLIGQFYAADRATSLETRLWTEFVEGCAADSAGQTWNELVQANPECGSKLNQLIGPHFAAAAEGQFADRKVGVTIESFPTTAVLTGDAPGGAYREAMAAIAEYGLKMNHTFGRDFKLSHPEDVKFGYWGRPERLIRIQNSLSKDEEKGRRFHALGLVPWKQVLRLSPAEPGLAPFKPFVNGLEPMLSAGGWSDLHPVQVLRAAGCENVIYVTRRGGESVFMLGVAKRLLNMDWFLPNQRALEGAHKAASGVLCTNWNDFDIKKDGVGGMIDDAYRAPLLTTEDRCL